MVFTRRRGQRRSRDSRTRRCRDSQLQDAARRPCWRSGTPGAAFIVVFEIHNSPGLTRTSYCLYSIRRSDPSAASSHRLPRGRRDVAVELWCGALRAYLQIPNIGDKLFVVVRKAQRRGQSNSARARTLMNASTRRCRVVSAGMVVAIAVSFGLLSSAQCAGVLTSLSSPRICSFTSPGLKLGRHAINEVSPPKPELPAISACAAQYLSCDDTSRTYSLPVMPVANLSPEFGQYQHRRIPARSPDDPDCL